MRSFALAGFIYLLSGLSSGWLAAQTGPTIVGKWYLSTIQTDTIRVLANEANDQEIIVAEQNGQLIARHVRGGEPLPLELFRSIPIAQFFTAGGTRNDPVYRFVTRNDGSLTVLTKNGEYRFLRTKPRNIPAAPSMQSAGGLAIDEPWTKRQWFNASFLEAFKRATGEAFLTCATKKACLRVCDNTDVCKDNFDANVHQVLQELKSADPLFYDREAWAGLSQYAHARATVLDKEDLLRRQESKSLLAFKTVTLNILTELTANGSPQIARPADNDAYYRQAIESISCTAAGFIPLVGDLASLGCGVHSLSGLSVPTVGAAETNSLSDAFTKLIDAHEAQHKETYGKWEKRVSSAILDYGRTVELSSLVADPSFRTEQPSDDKIADLVLDAVWPYAFLIVGTGTRTDFDTPADCIATLRALASIPPALSPMPPSARLEISMHHDLAGADFFYKSLSSAKSSIFYWTLNIGSIGGYKPISQKARDRFDLYKRRNPDRLIYSTLMKTGRVYASTPYAVRRNIQAQIHHVNDNFVDYDPENRGVLSWPVPELRTEPLDNIGLIRKSVAGRSGRVALPNMRCSVELKSAAR